MSTNHEEVESLENQIDLLEQEIIEKKKELARLRKTLPRFEIQDYAVLAKDGQEVRLSELFGQHDELMMIHNMGKSCSYCTMWADGFNGVVQHLENKAAFVVATPDEPAVQKQIAEERGWSFTMVSTVHSTLKKDVGFEKEEGYYPGVSIITRDKEGKLYHEAKAYFGPGDDYCLVWHLFDLLPSGSEDWSPSLRYE